MEIERLCRIDGMLLAAHLLVSTAQSMLISSDFPNEAKLCDDAMQEIDCVSGNLAQMIEERRCHCDD